jgi:hypothetical protein
LLLAADTFFQGIEHQGRRIIENLPILPAGQTSSPSQSLHHDGSSTPPRVSEVPESLQLSPRMRENPSFSPEIHSVSSIKNLDEPTTDDYEKRGDGNELLEPNSLMPKSPVKDIDETKIDGDRQAENNNNNEQDVCTSEHPVQETACRNEGLGQVINFSFIAMVERDNDNGAMPYSEKE